jgi:WD40 repeat protein
MFINIKIKMNVLILSLLLLSITAACYSTSTTAKSTPSLIPSASETLAQPITNTPTITPTPRFTETPAPDGTASASVPCFVTYYDPFAFLPDSLSLLVRAGTGVQVFSLLTMQQDNFLTSPSNLNGPVVALSPDGKLLAWAFDDGAIQLIRVYDQVVVYTISSGQASPIKLEFSPTGDRLYSASHDGTLKVWDLDGNPLNGFHPGGSELMNFGISPDGTMLATIPSDGEISLWNPDNFKLITGLNSSGGYDTSDVAFSPDGQFIAADLASGLFLWKMPDRKELLGASSAINSMAVAYSPAGRYLAYSNLNDVFLSSPDGSQTSETLKGHQSPVFELLFSPDGSILVSADDMEIRVWRVDNGELLAIGKSSCP